MAEKNPLELFVFTDEPVRDLEHDHLALRPFSSMVAAALTNHGPFNIGVFSGWGQGKFTVQTSLGASAFLPEVKRAPASAACEAASIQPDPEHA